MVSIQPLSSFWSRAPLSKAFTTSHLMMIWENYDIYIRLQLPYSTCCCCLLLLLVTCTCSFWTLLAETERRSQPPLSPVWWRDPQLVTLVTLDQPQIETAPPLSLSEGLILCQVSTLIDLGLSMLQFLSIRSCSSSSQSHQGQKWLNHQARCCLSLLLPFREGSGYQVRWFFGKIPNGPWPPPHYWKIMLQILYGYGRIDARRHRPDSIS